MKILKFSTAYCAPCKVIALELQRIAVPVQSINCHIEPELARQYKVASVPTLVFIEDGEEVGRLVGMHRSERIEEYIKEISNDKN